MSPEDVARRRAAKRFNERVKLVAAFLNTSSVATLVGAYLLPSFSGRDFAAAQVAAIFIFAVATHMAAQAALTLLRSED